MRLKLFLLVFLASCNLKPCLETPYVCIPATWRISTDEASAWCNLRWWQQFNDDVLSNYIVKALENNRDLKRAAWRVLEYKALWGVASADLYPQFSGVFQKFRQESSLLGGSNFPGIPRVFNFYSALAQVTYELDLYGRLTNISDAAFADYIAEFENKRNIVLTLVANVANSYINLRRLDLQLDISNKTLDSRIEALHINTLRFEGGVTSELEVKQAETEVESAKAAIIRVERMIANEENLLSVLIGDSPEERERGLPLDMLTVVDFVPAGLPSELLMQRPDLRQKESVLEATTYRIGEARAMFFPQISLTGNYGQQSLFLESLFTGPARTWQYGGSLTQPFFQGFRIKNLNDVADAREKEALYDYEYAIQNAFKEVNDALSNEVKAKELQVVLTKQVAVVAEYLHLATLQYDNGQTDYLSVLDAQRRLFDAQLDLAQAQGDTFIALIDVYRSLGGGWVVDADNLSNCVDDTETAACESCVL